MSKRKVLTTDGEALPALAASTSAADVQAALHLLEYARSRGFRIGPAVKVGCVEMLVADIRQGKIDMGDDRHGDSMPDPYEGTDDPEPGTAG